MKFYPDPKYYIFFLCASVLNFNLIFGQTFKRIESQSKLNDLAENNGVAIADYDGDNDLDLFVVAKAKDQEGINISHSRLFQNNNDGTFQDVTEESGLQNLYPFTEADIEGGFEGFKFGASWGDYDNDGYPDLFLTNAYRVQLFHNEGNGKFIELTSQAGLNANNNCNNTSATWFDFDKDGFLDIFIGDWAYCDTNSLYKNNGDGSFTNATSLLSAPTNKLNTYLGMPFDINIDGWVDLYISNDVFTENHLYTNNEGLNFTEEAKKFNIDDANNGMGITIGDYNNDGLFDVFVTNIGKNALLKNNGDNTFSNLAIDQNVYNTGWAWDTRFADFDLDGDEDLFVTNGYTRSDHNLYFKNLHLEGSNVFTDVSEQVNFNDRTISMSAEVFDYDNDGDLDIFLANLDRPSYFYENKIIETDQPQILKWFKVSLEGTASNRDAIGSTVSITTNNGTYYRYYSGVGLLSQSLQPVHFGLGQATEILELNIKWPSGITETYRENLQLNSTIRAKESNGFETLDINPSIKTKGCTDPNSCSFNPEAIVYDGSCSYIESKQISGKTNSFFLDKETYTYALLENSQAQWSVSGGEIIDGQGTNAIIIKWGLEETGKITIIEYNQCYSLPVEMDVSLTTPTLSSNQSVSRLWMEALLESIRGDYARPTIHARNLFHTSVAMYDAWAIYDKNARPYLIGNENHNYKNTFDGFQSEESIQEGRNKTISYAVYRLLSSRFKDSPSSIESKKIFDLLMDQLGYDINFTSIDYSSGSSAALGNFIAQSILSYGYSDGSREIFDYSNAYYKPINPPLAPIQSGNNMLIDPNRWQPLSLETFIDQSGNLIENGAIQFLSPEWGNVYPFSLNENLKVSYLRNENNYSVYHDPGNPPELNTEETSESNESYQWGFSLVSIWGSHLDPEDNVIWDISPKSIGNINIDFLPNRFEDYPNFYNLTSGGDIGKGHSINPHTNNEYQEQLVPRGDYTRVLAEFWADGPDSETPPGHWFSILNYVNDHELFSKKLNGIGSELDALEWDVKSYFILGGAMHDAAIASWSIKGWYDYIRPISAIRFMAEKGQSTDPLKENYHITGIPLQEDYIEIIEMGDPLAGDNNENLGKIKLYTWRGHDTIENPENDTSGVGWILAENWWPYQRPTFVTPPFAGYVSGHSTYSRAAAEVMTLLTGDEFFPGGYGEFIARKNEFLAFEKGPSVDVKLQWATYRDASDQCSLSRIWGGIHPPADDLPGRKIGEEIGKTAYQFGIQYFQGENENLVPDKKNRVVFPNPNSKGKIFITNTQLNDVFFLVDMQGRIVELIQKEFNQLTNTTNLTYPPSISSGIYILKINNDSEIFIKN